MSKYGLLAQLTGGQDVLKTRFHRLDPAISNLETIFQRVVAVFLTEIEILCELSFEHLNIL